jgi:hypothetical protein
MPNNSFWAGAPYEQVYFGDGDNVNYDYFGALDIVGHEWTHGHNYGFNILQTYDGETGAVNESLADINGCFVALDHPADVPNPWHHGEQVHLTGRGRDLADPSRDEFDVVQYDDTSNATKYASMQNGFYPDHYSIRYTGNQDNHGVHINSPIISHAIYLMVTGGTHRLSGVAVIGIGQPPVEQMVYHAMSTPGLLGNTSVFADFRIAMILACQTLYPENLDYLATVKTAFHAIGVGPDLFVRDTLADAGEEPGTLSCMSPDIIVRQTLADAATLVQIADLTDSTLGQNIELGPNDHYVYFRVQNRGSAVASGTFRLFIAPVSTFPTPATWNEVGHYDFPAVAASGGVWVPAAANQCITLPATLINALGLGHYCFIGIIESDQDPAPDRALIDNVAEFHAFISKSNNYAWRNCNIYDLVPDTAGNLPVTTGTFQVNGLDRRLAPRELEIDTRDLPKGAELVLWVPVQKALGLKAKAVPVRDRGLPVAKVAGALAGPKEELDGGRQIPLADLAAVGNIREMIPAELKRKEFEKQRPFRFAPGALVRLGGLELRAEERMNVRFAVRFAKKSGMRDATLAFRERMDGRQIGQMNYVFRVRG